MIQIPLDYEFFTYQKYSHHQNFIDYPEFLNELYTLQLTTFIN